MTSRIFPYLGYEDGDAALDFLATAFGFTEQSKMHMPDGSLGHADMDLDGAGIMLGHPPGYKSPRHEGRPSDVLVYVYVDDVDAHFRRAKAAGATILEEPTDQPYGDRRYTAEDPEGHHWTFATHIKEGQS